MSIDLIALKALRANMTGRDWFCAADMIMAEVGDEERAIVANLASEPTQTRCRYGAINGPGIVATHAAADLLIEVTEAALDLRVADGAPSMVLKALRRLYRILTKIEPWDDEKARHRLAALRGSTTPEDK